jgi:sec-independent protein translocase protein TatA
MPSIGPLELAIVLIIALVIFGPKRLPELGRSVGHGLREFKSSVTGENRDDEDDGPRMIENGFEEDEGATTVAAAQEDTEAQVSSPAPSRADTPPASRTGS